MDTPKPNTVIIIEDDKNVLEILNQFLTEAGFITDCRKSFAEASDLLIQMEDPDFQRNICAIIFDYYLRTMPPLTSIPILTKLKNDFILHPDLILMANSSDKECTRELLKNGCTHANFGDKFAAAEELLRILEERERLGS